MKKEWGVLLIFLLSIFFIVLFLLGNFFVQKTTDTTEKKQIKGTHQFLQITKGKIFGFFKKDTYTSPKIKRNPYGEMQGNKIGMTDPSAVYCSQLGYEYQIGKCIFPDNSECDVWDFYEGICGQKFSYCAQHDYEIIIKTDGQDSFSKNYVVCVLNGEEVGSVGEIMNLTNLSTVNRNTYQNIPESIESSGKTPPETYDLPNFFDWRNYLGYDWISPVQYQGEICASCWAFSAIGIIEAVYNIKSGYPNLDLNLSEQYLVTDFLSNNNCCGGTPGSALNEIYDYGIIDEKCMPYVDGEVDGCNCHNSLCSEICTYRNNWNECSDRRMNQRCSNWQENLKFLSCPDEISSPSTGGCWEFELSKQKLVDYGPLSTCLVMEGYFDTNNVYRCNNPSIWDINHCIVVVGYNDTEESWIVKNSWGPNWNEGGYFRVGYGECHIDDFWYAWTSVPNDIPPLQCGYLVKEDTVLTQDLLNCQGNGLLIGADEITLDCNNHQIDGASPDWHYVGVDIKNKNGVTIKNCDIKEFGKGIYLEDGSNNIIEDNIIHNNILDGIWALRSEDNVFRNNEFSNNPYYGIALYDSSLNTIESNIINNNHEGIRLEYNSENNILAHNTLSGNVDYAIKVVDYSNSNIFMNNYACQNNFAGIKCEFSQDNSGSENTFSIVNGCPEISYNFCYVCGNNGKFGFEGDTQFACNLISGCSNNLCWNLPRSGDSYSECWKFKCCGDDTIEYFRSTTIEGFTRKTCCDSPNDCVDSTGTCRGGTEICKNNIDDDCDDIIDCDDSDCFNDPLCVSCESNEDCPENWICINNYCALPECNPPCPEGYYCSNGICIQLQKCWWDNDCPAGCICERPYCSCSGQR